MHPLDAASFLAGSIAASCAADRLVDLGLAHAGATMPRMSEITSTDLRDGRGWSRRRAWMHWPATRGRRPSSLLSEADRARQALRQRSRGARARPRSSPPRADVEVDGQGEGVQGVPRRGRRRPGGVHGPRHRPELRLRGQALDRSAAGYGGPRRSSAEGETYAHGYLALAPERGGRETGDVEAALALAERAVEIANRSANTDLEGALADEPRLAEDRGGCDGRRAGAHGGGVARGGQRRALADDERGHDLPDDRRLPRPDRLPPGDRVDRGHREATASSSRSRVSRAFAESTGPRSPRSAAPGNEPSRTSSRPPTSSAATTPTPVQADGYYAIGEIRRLKGDLEGAEAALREAHARGQTPQPALALVRLAEGKVKAAAEAINTAIADETWDRWARARLLAAQVEIAIAAGDIARARTAIDELATIILELPLAGPRGRPPGGAGRVLLAEDDPTGAARELRAAIKGWREVGAPYEVARARALLSRAHARARRRGGRRPRAAARRSTSSADSGPASTPRPRSVSCATRRTAGADRSKVRKTFMFTDIVGSTNPRGGPRRPGLGAPPPLA